MAWTKKNIQIINPFYFVFNIKILYFIYIKFILNILLILYLIFTHAWILDILHKTLLLINSSKAWFSYPCILIIFPEGTRYTKEKFEIAQEFSKSKGIPIYDHLLVPKARGLWFLINNFKHFLDNF